MKHVTIRVDTIQPNPHRDLKRNPIREDQVQKLVESINETGFWDNVVVREHPTEKGQYQLAYGHNRLEAVKRVGIEEVYLPVADMNNWELYSSMVYENETQLLITPAVAFENVRAGLMLLEKAFKKIGPKGTEEQFNKILGRRRVVPYGTTRPDKLGRNNDGNAFEQALKAFFVGKGIGRIFVAEFLPGARMRPDTIAEVCNTIYGESRAAASTKEAEAKEAEAKEAEAKAKEEKDRKKAERLQRKAEAAKAKAKKLRELAPKLSEGVIAEDILLQFETSYQMTEFAQAIRRREIPEKYHRKAMEHVKKEKVSGREMDNEIRKWWFEESGEADELRKRRADKATDRRTRGGDIGEFLKKICEDAKDMVRDISMTDPYIQYYENVKHRKNACKPLENLKTKLTDLIAVLKSPVVLFDDNKETDHNQILPLTVKEVI